MTDYYIEALHSNLGHLRPLRPPTPRRNLAGSNTLSDTEDDSFLRPKIQWTPLPSGRAGTKVTVETMAKYARQACNHPDIQAFIRQRGFRTLADVESWTRQHFVYRDEKEEVLRTPVFMLQDMGRVEADRIVGLEGDCDDIAGFIAAITKCMGFPTRLTAIRYHSDNPDFEHVFAEAYQGGQWITLDPTVDEGTTLHALESMIVPV